MEIIDLLHTNSQGFIPGPEETEDEFYARISYCSHIKNELHNKFSSVGLELGDQEPFLEATPQTKKLFDMAPTWIPLFWGNYQLYPWHGGCAWIFKMDENSPTSAFIQMRQNFRSSKQFLFYNREEIIAHEISHVGRMMFNEPKFEEILAYQTSTSKIRRWFGAIAQSNFESMLFVITLIIILILHLSILTTHFQNYYYLLFYAKMIPVILLGAGIIRLTTRYYQLNNCHKNLKKIFNNEQTAHAVVYRLQDHEIIEFGKWSESQIIDYAKNNTTIRWRCIKENYFKTFFSDEHFQS